MDYMTRTEAATAHLYESTSNRPSPAVIKAMLKRGEKPNDADEMAA